MSQIYSVPSRESDLHALPDVEVFHLDEDEARDMSEGVLTSEAEAIADAQSEAWQFEEE